MSAGTAARKLGVTPQTVRDLVRTEDLDGIIVKGKGNVRGRWSISTASVQRMIDRGAELAKREREKG